MNETPLSKRQSNDAIPDDILNIIREKARALRFGVISLTIHDGRLTQLEITEKRRFGQ